MPPGWSLIRYESEGGTEYLYSDDECAAAIAAGSLNPETLIVMTRGGESYQLPAVVPLAHLFQTPDTPKSRADIGNIDLHDAESAASPEQERSERTPAAGSANADPAPDSSAVTDEPSGSQDAGVDPVGREKKSLFNLDGRGLFLPLIGVIVLTALLLAWLMWPKRNEMPMWTVRSAPLFETPSGRRIEGALVPRGTALKVYTAQPGWVEVADGMHDGGFLRVGDLIASAPPSLDSSEAGLRKMTKAAVILVSPDQSANKLKSVRAGEEVDVNGLVLPARQWAEVQFPDSADTAIGYVAATALKSVKIARPEVKEIKDEPKAIRQPEPVRESIASPVDPVMPRPRRQVCDDSADWVACMIGRDSQIATLNARLEQAWLAANQRARGSVPGMPPAAWRSARNDCRGNRSCLSSAFQLRLTELYAVQAVAVVQATAPKLANKSDVHRAARYPESAMRREEEGETTVSVLVGTGGDIISCSIARSSGSAALDEATCNAVRRRARFTPARGSNGQSMAARAEVSIKWQMPR
jgi:TonB family protein